MTSELPPELAEDQQQLDDIVLQARQLVERLSPEDFNRPAPDGGWSAGQCLDHINATYRLYLQAIPAAIERGRERGLSGPGEPRRGMLGRFFIKTLEPPVKSRLKTSKSLQPAEEQLDKEQVLAELVELHQRLGACFSESADLDLWRVKMASPVLPVLKFSLGEAYQILLAHDRRHLWQAERAVEAPIGAEVREEVGSAH